MLQVTAHMKILVAVEVVDFRKGIDGLVAYCKKSLDQDAFAGTLFVFRNRRATAIKILVYDGQGFWLCQKRLSAGRCSWWSWHPGRISRPQRLVKMPDPFLLSRRARSEAFGPSRPTSCRGERSRTWPT
jgi:hypothetical protein